MSQAKIKTNIFNYKDYRAYLRDWYETAKKVNSAVSYRSLAKAAGFKAFSFLKLVMEGKRNLTEESLVKLAGALRLNKQELDFFRNLVHLNQAKTNQEKSGYYQHLVQSRKYSQLKPLEKCQFAFYSTWYHPIIRELAVSKDFDGTPEWLARKIHPNITVTQAQKSLELLENLGFLKKDEAGHWTQSHAILTTGADIGPLIMLNYHKSIFKLNEALINETLSSQSDISSLTIGVSRSRVDAIKLKIKAFRQDILKMISDDLEPEDVLLLNIQLLPVTRHPEMKNP